MILVVEEEKEEGAVEAALSRLTSRAIAALDSTSEVIEQTHIHRQFRYSLVLKIWVLSHLLLQFLL